MTPHADRTAGAYESAQCAMSMLKSAVYNVLLDADDQGARNVDIGRTLGIYTGHSGHAGHISRTLLEVMKGEGVVAQDPQTERWSLTKHIP